jgi:hypothetical protein
MKTVKGVTFAITIEIGVMKRERKNLRVELTRGNRSG